MDPLTSILGAAGLPGATNGEMSPAAVITAIGLSLVLTLVIGVVYQKSFRGAAYSQEYVQTLVLLGMVVAAVIMGIGGNLARAVGVVAAFSLIRNRSVLPEARDLGFLFFAIAVGAAAGGGQYVLAILTTTLVCMAILAMSYLDLFAPERPSHILRVRVTNDIDFEAAFTAPFERLLDRVKLLSVEAVQAGLMSEVCYAVRLRAGVTTHELMNEVLRRNGNNRAILTAASAAAVADD